MSTCLVPSGLGPVLICLTILWGRRPLIMLMLPALPSEAWHRSDMMSFSSKVWREMWPKYFSLRVFTIPSSFLGHASVWVSLAFRGRLVARLRHRGSSFLIRSRARASLEISSSHRASSLNLAPRYLSEETSEIGSPFTVILIGGAFLQTFITSVFLSHVYRHACVICSAVYSCDEL